MATHDHAHHPAPNAAHAAHDAAAHAAHAHHAPGADQKPAFLGLIIGGLALGGILWGTVILTNMQFAGHAKEGGATPAAAEAGH